MSERAGGGAGASCVPGSLLAVPSFLPSSDSLGPRERTGPAAAAAAAPL